jgi:hypothetical protein
VLHRDLPVSEPQDRMAVVKHVVVTQAIPQHVMARIPLDLSPVGRRWPSFSQTFPVSGLHPFT